MFGPFFTNFQVIKRLDQLNSFNQWINTFIPPLTMLIYCLFMRSLSTNIYALFTAVMLISISCPTFSRCKLSDGSESKYILKQGSGSKIIMIFCMVIMMIMNLAKGGLLVYALVFNEPMPLNQWIFQGKYDAYQTLKEGGFTIIIESFLLTFMFRCLKNYYPLVLNIKDCYYWMKKKEGFGTQSMIQIIDLLVIFGIVTEINWVGFFVGSITSLMMLFHSPFFRKIAPKKYISMWFISCMVWIVILYSFFQTTPSSYYKLELPKFQLNILKLYQDDKWMKPSVQLLFFFAVGVFSCNTMWRLRVGELGREFFPKTIENVKSSPPKTEFSVLQKAKIKQLEKSYYMNYFIKKISLIQNIRWEKALTDSDRLNERYLEDIPYVNSKKLIEKYQMYGDFKEVHRTMSKKKMVLNFLKIIWEAVFNFITINNIITIIMLSWIVFFMFFKNYVPTIWTLIALIGIACIGVVKFEHFLKVAQTFIVIPLFVNLITTYLANLHHDPLKCASTNQKKWPCYEFLGIIREKDAGSNNISNDAFFLIVLNIALFKLLTFLFKITENSDHLFKVRTIMEMNIDIDESFSKGNIPLIRIFFVKVASNFYIICYIMMIFVGTRGPTLVSMVLLAFLLVFVSSKKPISTHWAIFYHTMNFIIICGFLLDLLMKSTNGFGSSESSENTTLDSFILFVGLPSKQLDETRTKFNKTNSDLVNENKTSNQTFLALYLCCLVQQIASKNKYLEIYLAKIETMKNKKNLVEVFKKFTNKLLDFFNFLYYKIGIWVAYIINIYLTMTLSIVCSRFLLLLFIFYILVKHLSALRESNKTGYLDLKRVYKLWVWYFRAKIVVLLMFMAGAFILSSWIRGLIGMDNDALDFEILNYLGVENLDHETVTSYPNLQNCVHPKEGQTLFGRDIFIADLSKLGWYFVAESLMFITTRMSMQIIKIQMIYHENIHQALYKSKSTDYNIARLKKKPQLYRVYKIYHKFMLPKSSKKKNKKMKFMNNIFMFMARIYTTLNYAAILFFSLLDKKICIFIFIYLVFFFRYFIRINRTFLGYMIREDVEKIVDLKLDYFYEKYLSKYALKGQINEFDKVLKRDDIEEEKDSKYTHEQIRKYIGMDLFQVSVKLRLRITDFEVKNKNKIYWASIMVSMLIILLTYMSALIQWFPLFTTNSEKDKYLNIWKTISKILGADFQANGEFCMGNNMLLYVFLFFISSIDVYVMNMIGGLQSALTRQLNDLENLEKTDIREREEDLSEDELEEMKLKKFQRMKEIGGLNYDSEDNESLLESDLSSIESEAEDGKIISKETKKKKLNNLVLVNTEDEIDYDEAVRRSEMVGNEINLDKNTGSRSSSNNHFREDDLFRSGINANVEGSPDNNVKLSVIQRMKQKKQGGTPELTPSPNRSPFKSSFINNNDDMVNSPLRRGLRDTAQHDLNLDLREAGFSDSEEEKGGIELQEIRRGEGQFSENSENENGENDPTFARKIGNNLTSGMKKIFGLTKDTFQFALEGNNEEEEGPSNPSLALAGAMKAKNKFMKMGVQMRHKKWNFAEFYEVSENEDEFKVRAHIKYKKIMKKDENSSDSDSESENLEEKDENKHFIDLNSSPDHIISFYYRNMKKYNKIKIFKSTLEIQQKMIAAIFITILLFKQSHVVIVLYLIYISYFYFNKEKNVKTLEITAMFLLFITLSQYFILLLRQPVSIQENEGNKTKMEVWAFLLNIINREYFNNRLGLLQKKIFGKLTLDFDSSGNVEDEKSINDFILLQLDAFPTIFFQLIIFIYDHFLFYLSRNTENTMILIKTSFLKETTGPDGKKLTVIDYKKWKDVSYKLLQYFINIVYVRINELVIVVQLMVNILTKKPFWNVLRLAFIVIYYSMIGFRSVKEYKIIIQRIRKVLLSLQIFVWIRVIFGKTNEILIEIYRVYITYNVKDLDKYNAEVKEHIDPWETFMANNLTLEVTAKLLTVIELFLVEIVYGLYHSNIFLERQAKILEKKMLRADLISLCMAYELNETKLMKVVKCYQEKNQLSKNINSINGRITTWKKLFTGSGKNSKTTTDTQVEHEKIVMLDTAENKKEEKKSLAKEHLSRLMQTAPVKTKIIFNFYKIVLSLKNPFMFMNVLSLYDFICLRNNKLIDNPKVKLQNYLSHEFGIIKKNVETIQKIYAAYANDIKRSNTFKFLKTKILEKKKNIFKNSDMYNEMMNFPKIAKSRNRRTSNLKSVKGRGSVYIRNFNEDLIKKAKREGEQKGKADINIASLVVNPLLRNFVEVEEFLKQFQQYEFQKVQLVTDTNHKFYKLLVGDEINTIGFSVLKTRVVLYMLLEVIISNWHIFCYAGMMAFCFINGGVFGFLFIIFLIAFVIIEEAYPSLIFWRAAFFTACASLISKLIILEIFLDRTAKETIDSAGKYPAFEKNFLYVQWSYFLIGSADGRIDSIVIILIIIQLILLDEMGIKHKKVTQFEDTSTAFVRMRLNEVFKIMYTTGFKMRTLYLTALHNGCENQNNNSNKNLDNLSDHKTLRERMKSGISDNISRKLKNNVKSSRRRKKNQGNKADDLNDKIDLQAIKTYEEEERTKNHNEMKSTAKKIDSIFLTSFKELSAKNMKSFFWQNFSIYSRKPGVDLSPFIVLSLALFTFYGAWFINQLMGQPKTFLDQMYVNNSVSVELTAMVVIGILLIIFDRVIYKINPKEWREKLNNSRKKQRKPQTMEELHKSIKYEIEENTEQKNINWKILLVREGKEGKKKKGRRGTKKRMKREIVTKGKEKKVRLYKKNPLWTRYWYQIWFLCLVTLICGVYFPLKQIDAQTGSIECLVPDSLALPDYECVFFQSSGMIRGFYAFALIYVILSALQVRYGEPINKGKRVVMSEPTKLYYLTNKVARAIPFFFTAATCLDFMLTPTSLEFFEWIKFESIYNTLFEDIYKMRARDKRIAGIKISRSVKFVIGIFGTFAQILVILIPFLMFRNWGQEVSNVVNAELRIDLFIKQDPKEKSGTRMKLYEDLFIKSIGTIYDTQYSKVFKEKNSGGKEFQLNKIQRNNIRMITYYKPSKMVFSPSLKRLEQVTEQLVKQQGTGLISLIMTIGFEQDGSSQKSILEQHIPISQESQDKIIEVFTLLRNINESEKRVEYLNEGHNIYFKVLNLISLPNKGKPIYGENIEGLVNKETYEELQRKKTLTDEEKVQLANTKKFFIDVSLKVEIARDSLTGAKELKWIIQSKNPYAAISGEEGCFYIFVVVSEKADSTQTGTVRF